MKYFVATAALAAFASASATQQIEHMWKTSPLYKKDSDCAADEPEWECIMRPLLAKSAGDVKKIEDEWTAEKRKELTELNIQLEVAKKEHYSAVIKAGAAQCSHDREAAMRELYRCEMRALRSYTSSVEYKEGPDHVVVSYQGPWTNWLES